MRKGRQVLPFLRQKLTNTRHIEKILSALAFSGVMIAGHAQQPPQFETMSLTAGRHVIKAGVALTQEQREYGLMFRQKIGPNEGMLFLFPGPGSSVCMWMKNTLLPLSVAFIDEKGVIVNIEDMAPQTLDAHCAAKPVRYALEMRRGW